MNEQHRQTPCKNPKRNNFMSIDTSKKSYENHQNLDYGLRNSNPNGPKQKCDSELYCEYVRRIGQLIAHSPQKPARSKRKSRSLSPNCYQSSTRNGEKPGRSSRSVSPKTERTSSPNSRQSERSSRSVSPKLHRPKKSLDVVWSSTRKSPKSEKVSRNVSPNPKISERPSRSVPQKSHKSSHYEDVCRNLTRKSVNISFNVPSKPIKTERPSGSIPQKSHKSSNFEDIRWSSARQSQKSENISRNASPKPLKSERPSGSMQQKSHKSSIYRSATQNLPKSEDISYSVPKCEGSSEYASSSLQNIERTNDLASNCPNTKKFEQQSKAASSLNLVECESETNTQGSEDVQRANQIIEDLNIIFAQRLNNVDSIADGDIELKFTTYQEWVDTLVKVTKDLIDSFNTLEIETSQRIAKLESKLSNCIETDCNIKIECLKMDRDNLVKIIHRAMKHNQWSMDGLYFTTLDRRDIFGKDADQYLDQAAEGCCNSSKNITNQKSLNDMKELLVEKELQIKRQDKENEILRVKIYEMQKLTKQNEKIAPNIKALAVEVAEKYDEIREMRKQIVAFEEEILNAQKKIQLKDDVIKELRNDLKALVKLKMEADTINSASTLGTSTTTVIPKTDSTCKQSINESGDDDGMTLNNALIKYNCSKCNSPHYDYNYLAQLESQQLKELNEQENKCMEMLKHELMHFASRHHLQNANMEENKHILSTQHDKISSLVQHLFAKLRISEEKLDYLRTNLLSNVDKELYVSKTVSNVPIEKSVEWRIVTTIRNRLEDLETDNKKLRGQIQQLNINAQSMVDTKEEIIENNSSVLKNVASALSNACGQEIPYENIIPPWGSNEKPGTNLFSKAIAYLTETLQQNNNEICTLKAKIAELNEEICAKNKELSNCNNYEKEETSSEFVKLLESKNFLEIECNNQLMVINNLREALETCKRESNIGNMRIVSSSTSFNSSNQNNHHTNNGGTSSSIWTWWKDNVHNV